MHAQWRAPEFKSRLGATHSSAVEGVSPAISAWPIGKANRVLGREVKEEDEGKFHVDLVISISEREVLVQHHCILIVFGKAFLILLKLLHISFE